MIGSRSTLVVEKEGPPEGAPVADRLALPSQQGSLFVHRAVGVAVAVDNAVRAVTVTVRELARGDAPECFAHRDVDCGC